LIKVTLEFILELFYQRMILACCTLQEKKRIVYSVKEDMTWAIKMVWPVLHKILHQHQRLRVTSKTGPTRVLSNKLTRVHLCHVLVDLELIWVARAAYHAQHIAKDALTQSFALKKTSKETPKQARYALNNFIHFLISNHNILSL